MKKYSFPYLASVFTMVALFTSFANAQVTGIQAGGDGIVVSGKVALSKGTYRTFAFGTAPGVTSTMPTATTSGTIATMNVAGSAEIATVTTTVTGTLDKKTIVKGKLGNKELLQLILNTTNASDLKGQSLVWATVGGGILGPKPGPNEGSSPSIVGAADLKASSITVRIRDQFDGNTLGVRTQESGVLLLTSVVAGKKNTNERTATGYGYADLSGRAALGTFSKSLIAGVATLDFTIKGEGPYKETYFQNPNTGVITNSSKGSLGSKSVFDGVTLKAL
jgi:hypothetical protein